MASQFDPYRVWLGIPAGKRPPTHYELLGIAPDEQDADVIHAAVLRHSGFVRNFQKGEHGDDATRVLNELAAAEACLTDGRRRAAYDAQLPRRTQPESKRPRPLAAPRIPAESLPVAPPLHAAWTAPPEHVYSQATPWQSLPPRWGQPQSRGRSLPVWLWASVAIGSCIVALLIVALVLGWGTRGEAVAEAEAKSASQPADDLSPLGSERSVVHPVLEVRPEEATATPPPPSLAEIPEIAPAEESQPAAPPPIRFNEAQMRVRRFLSVESSACCMAFSPDGRRLGIGRFSSDFVMVDVSSGTLLATNNYIESLGMVTACAISSGKLITGGFMGPIVVWDLPATGTPVFLDRILGHRNQITCLAIRPDGSCALAGDMDATLCYWDLISGRQIHRWEGFEEGILACCILADGTTAIATDGTIAIIADVDSGAVLRTIDFGATSKMVCIAPNGRYAALERNISDVNDDIEIWGLEQGERVGTVHVGSPIGTMVFSPESRFLAVAVYDDINIWDVPSWQHVLTIPDGCTSFARPLVVSPDGRKLATVTSISDKGELIVTELPPPQ